MVYLKPLIDKLMPTNINKNKLLGLMTYGEDDSGYIKNIKKIAEQLDVFVCKKNVKYALDMIDSFCDVCNYVLPIKPFPQEIEDIIKMNIDYNKDIDDFAGANMFNNCTAEGVLEILKYLNIGIDKHILIIGRGVGRDIFDLLERNDYTVTLAHSKTSRLEYLSRQADVVISATGEKNLINKYMVKMNATVIDVGLGDICKDVQEVAYVTPIKDGVGAVTSAILFKHINVG